LNFIGIDRILSPAEWLRRLDSNRLQPSDICITFDDSLMCQFDVALPILERYKLKAFWFIYSNVFEGQINKLEVYRAFRLKNFKHVDEFYDVFLEKVFVSEFGEKAKKAISPSDLRRYQKTFPFYSPNDIKFRFIRDRVLQPSDYEYIMDGIIKDRGVKIGALTRNLWMSNENLKYLSDKGHGIGLHSYSHPTRLAGLAYKDQRMEYGKNYEHIESITSRPPLVAAHPVNSYDLNTFRILEKLNIRCGFRSNMFPGEITGKINGHKYEMAREDSANIIRMMEKSK